jgi:hypothetical protein
MAPRKRAVVSARTVRKWRDQLDNALKAIRQAELQVRKLKKSTSLVSTRSR